MYYGIVYYITEARRQDVLSQCVKAITTKRHQMRPDLSGDHHTDVNLRKCHISGKYVYPAVISTYLSVRNAGRFLAN